MFMTKVKNSIMYLSIAIAGCFAPLSLSANEIDDNISFQNPLANKDVVTGEVSSIFQDSNGFMWFGGGSGLFRFDAYDLKQIDTIINGERKSVKFAKGIFEDSKRRIWLSSRNGLYIYNPTSETIDMVKDNAGKPAIRDVSFLKTMELPTGEILACSMNGLYIIDPKTLTYQVMMPDPNTKTALHGNIVNTAMLGSDGYIWLGTNKGIERFNWSDRLFTRHKPSPSSDDLAPENYVTDLKQDKNGNFWVGTSKGLIYFDYLKNTMTRYVNDPADKFSIGSNDIWSIIIDSNGVVWVGSDGGGLAVYNKEKNNFTNIKNKPGNLSTLNTNQVRTVYEDRNGDIWTGNFQSGINFYDRSSSFISIYTNDVSNPDSISKTTVVSVAEDADENLWVGTEMGLNYFNRKTGIFSLYKHDPANDNSISGNAISATFITNDGSIMSTSYNVGLNILDVKNQKFTRIPLVKVAPEKSVSVSKSLNGFPSIWTFKKDADTDDLWLASRTGGISRYHKETQEYTNYYHLDSDPDSIINNSTWFTLEDSKGNFWVGTAGGLDRLDKTTGKFEHYKGLSNPSAISGLEDSKGRLWIGTDSGLNLLDRETKTFKVFNKTNGLLDDTIRKIIEDRNGKLWLSTFNGFASFDPDTHKIKNYNRVAGKLLGGYSRSGLLSKKGEIVLAGVNGLQIFDPSNMQENKVKPKVVFTDFKLFSDSVVIGGDGGVLSKSINETDEITLDYKKSMFTLSFAALNYRDSDKNQYSYKLEGFDSDWINAGNARTAKYTNLGSGTYTFRVKASNNDGVWSDSDKTVKIIQLPPPWKTWWAYTIYVLLVILGIYLIIRHQIKKQELIIEQNRLLEITISERTVEVIEKSKDIKSMLSNIQQGLFTVKADRTIHKEYSAFMETIFETTDIGGHDIVKFLLDNSTIGTDDYDTAYEAMNSMLGCDEINFDFNCHLLPAELEYKLPGHNKILAIEWNPIINFDGIIEKLMVTVKDVTQLKLMEAESKENKRRLDIVNQLLNITSNRFFEFESTSNDYIEENIEILNNISGAVDLETIDTLFRNMHTIKGNCRTFGFTYLSNVVHDAETIYSDLKAAKAEVCDVPKLLGDLESTKLGIKEYSDVYRNVLGRGKDSSGRKPGFWFQDVKVDELRTLIEAGDLSAVKSYVNQLNVKKIPDCFSDLVISLTSIAAQLGKKTPNVTINDSPVLVKQSGQRLINDVFTHVLRNSIDHGLEATDDRIAAGKSVNGNILINTSLVDNKLHIMVSDDGKGLDLARLYVKGIESGNLDKDSVIYPRDIANLIFAAGISTAVSVTDISGRGVGMDAVKHYVERIGGSVNIEILEPDASLPYLKQLGVKFVKFALIVTLPEDILVPVS